MISFKAAFAVAALLVSVPAIAEQGPQPADDSVAPDQSYDAPRDRSYDAPRAHRGRGAHRMTTEQRIMFRMAMRDQLRGMPREQRRAFMQQQRSNFRALSAEEKQDRLADLEQQWNALPQARRDRLMQKFADRHQRRMNNHQQRSGDDSYAPQQ